MKERKPPHQQLTVKDNGLTTMQEVIYQKDFKRADKAAEKDNQNNQTKKFL